MEADLTAWRSLATVLAFIAFVSVCLWAYSSSRKNDFDEAANLPFADDSDSKASATISQNKGQN